MNLLSVSLAASILIIIDDHVFVLWKLESVCRWIDCFLGLSCRWWWIFLHRCLRVLCRLLVICFLFVSGRVVCLGVAGSGASWLDKERVAILACALVFRINWLDRFYIGHEVFHWHLKTRLMLLLIGPMRQRRCITAEVFSLGEDCLLVEWFPPIDARTVGDLICRHERTIITTKNDWLLCRV